MREEEFDDYRDMKNPNGHPDRIKGNMIQHPQLEPILKGELEYGTILPNGEDWRLRRFDDAGMGETEYRLFKNGIFFAQFDNRKDVDTVMGVMTCNPQPERDCPTCGGKLMCHLWCIDSDCGWDSIKESHSKQEDR